MALRQRSLEDHPAQAALGDVAVAADLGGLERVAAVNEAGHIAHPQFLRGALACPGHFAIPGFAHFGIKAPEHFPASRWPLLGQRSGI